MFFWIGFIVFVFVVLALDLGIFNKKAHVVSAKEAFRMTGFFVVLSLAFSVFIYFAYSRGWMGNGSLSGQEAVLQYLTGYLVEQSLSMDNVFVIALVFGYFKVPSHLQHRVLFWGILGAIVFRGLMIGLGAILIKQFEEILYFFGLILLYSSYKMLRSDQEAIHPENNPAIKLLRRFFPITQQFHQDHFFVRIDNKQFATPLFVTLLVIETTDIVFAIDSIPAIFGITTDPFIVFTSNIFAILGLRSLYFVLAALIDKFHYLKYSLVGILAFVGLKMLTVKLFHLPEWLSLVVIVIFLGVGIALSLWIKPKHEVEQVVGTKEKIQS
ncbi:MAG: TerC family protein [Saprospiraceae bacterium]|nr:TerC family protein [Saprospiraceae bacterium]